MLNLVKKAFLFVTLFLVAGCASSVGKEGGQLWGKLGATIFDVLKSPNSVNYYKLTPSLPGPRAKSYQPASAPVELSAEDTRTLQMILLNDKSYSFDATKSCVFVPESGFTFKKGEREVQVAISSKCKQVQFSTGEQGFLLDIDNGYESIAKLISQLPANAVPAKAAS